MVVNYETVLELTFFKEIVNINSNKLISTVFLVVDEVKCRITGTRNKTGRVGRVRKNVVYVSKFGLIE